MVAILSQMTGVTSKFIKDVTGLSKSKSKFVAKSLPTAALMAIEPIPTTFTALSLLAYASISQNHKFQYKVLSPYLAGIGLGSTTFCIQLLVETLETQNVFFAAGTAITAVVAYNMFWNRVFS